LKLEINTDGVPKNLIAMLNHIKFVKNTITGDCESRNTGDFLPTRQKPYQI